MGEGARSTWARSFGGPAIGCRGKFLRAALKLNSSDYLNFVKLKY